MRGYITNISSEQTTGQRGGFLQSESGDYAIEVGAKSRCEAEPVIYATYWKELQEFLDSCRSPLGRLLLDRINEDISDFKSKVLEGQASG